VGARAKGLLKGELKRKGVTYDALAELKAMGVEETSASVANKLSRGSFSAVFLLQVMEAIGCKVLRLADE
jgi:hypothetical protein